MALNLLSGAVASGAVNWESRKIKIERLNNMAEKLDKSDQTASGVTSGASKLSLLVAFIAGAFAAWIIISSNVLG